jgi:hypothetical protein
MTGSVEGVRFNRTRIDSSKGAITPAGARTAGSPARISLLLHPGDSAPADLGERVHHAVRLALPADLLDLAQER